MELLDFPLLVLIVSFVVLLLAAWTGNILRERTSKFPDEEQGDYGVVLGATLTLLGLLIGFSFSMAVSRYDQRVLFYTTGNQQVWRRSTQIQPNFRKNCGRPCGHGRHSPDLWLPWLSLV